MWLLHGLYDWIAVVFFFFKQKTAYEMRISDWSSDVCSSDLLGPGSAIVNTTSITAYQGYPKMVDYSATRGAIVAFTRSMAGALVDKGKIGRASCRERVCQYV